MKHREKLWSCLLAIALIALMSGCGSGDNAGSTGSVDPDAGLPVIVTVTDYSGIRVPDATVVLGYSNGAMKSYGDTDADGQITFENAPVNATITAAKTCLRTGSTTTTYSIDVEYDVNGSVVLTLDTCAVFTPTLPPASDSSLGAVTVNVTDTPGDVIRNQMTLGRQIFVGYGSPITRQTVTVRESDLDGTGTFSVVVRGFNAEYETVAYGLLLNQAFTGGMTVDVQMQPMSFVQFQITNIPTTAVSLWPYISIFGSGSGGVSSLSGNSSHSLASAPSSTTIKATYIPVPGDRVSYQLSVDLDQDNDGAADSQQRFNFTVSAGTPTDQSFDLSKALPVPAVTVTGADTATPTFSWSGVDPAATTIYVSAGVRSSTADLYLGFSDLMRSRTSIRYPELPDSLAAFRPTNVDYFYVDTYVNEGGISKSSYGRYQAP